MKAQTMQQAPREDLIRMVPLERADVAGDGNTLVGFAAVFNDWVEIDSWEGTFRERIDPKAFDKTLKESGERVKVLFNHGMDPQIGDKPLGKPALMEPRSKGLWTETPMDETSYNSDLKVLLKSGALDGMSFRFSVMDESWEDGEDGQLDERTIREVKLFEFGPVTFPAYEATSAGMRTRAQYEVWRKAQTEAVPPTDEGRSSDEDAAPEDEGRDTSLETWKAKVTVLRADVVRSREVASRWQAQES